MKNSVQDIINNGKCYACGMCYSVCPSDALKIIADRQSGFYRLLLDENKCINCSKCKRVCPAVCNDNAPLDSVGSHKFICLSHSVDFNVRKMSTSGGVVNSLLRYLIENDIIDCAYVVKENIDCDFECELVKITCDNVKLLNENPRSFASRYVNFPVLSAFKDFNTSERAAVVATPCQIYALNKYDTDNRIFKIGIACSAATSYNATKIIKEKYADMNHHIFYRGNGWPGKNSLIKDSHIVEKSHIGSDFEKMYSSQIFKRKSCCNCADHFACNADISLFDFWNEEEKQHEFTGNSAVIIRTDRGQEFFDGALKHGYIEIKSSVSQEDAIRSQYGPLFNKHYKIHKKFPLNIYFKTVDIINKTKLYKVIPTGAYKYFCKILSKLTTLAKRNIN